MRFDMKGPCADCPFLRGSSTNQTLSKERLNDIVGGMNTDHTFTCHKTLEVPSIDQQHCGGALVFVEKETIPNSMIQIAERLGLYDRTGLKMDADIIENINPKRRGYHD